MPESPYRVAMSIDGPYRDGVRWRSLAAVVRRTLMAEKARGPLLLSVIVTNDKTVRRLNQRFRGKDTATDVLSFGLGDHDGFPAQRTRPLGEIVISFPTARRQARELGHSVEDELAHLLVHGVLHLLGYDHERPRDAKAMRAREDALLGRKAH